MIKKLVEGDPRNWDQLLPESTGFSSFELLYEWRVRGPLDLMKEMWSGSVSRPKSVVSRVINTRERLTSMTDLVKDKM